jgi:asparagine synthase (glutamine-hydrolysing)
VCGLAGYVRLGGGAGGAAAAGPLLRSMAGILRRRGPDGAAFRQDGPVGVAFTRLSIVDPVGGDQPFVSDDGTISLIANGEVYNHLELEATLPPGTQMKTGSDCEVLLHLYQRDGLRFLDRVRGIFAVAIYDSARRRMIFARDRFGIKPLYFHHNASRVIFASEIKALFADPDCPRRLNWQQCLADQLMTSAPAFELSEPITYFEEIESVPAAHIVALDVATGEGAPTGGCRRSPPTTTLRRAS